MRPAQVLHSGATRDVLNTEYVSNDLGFWLLLGVQLSPWRYVRYWAPAGEVRAIEAEAAK